MIWLYIVLCSVISCGTFNVMWCDAQGGGSSASGSQDIRINAQVKGWVLLCLCVSVSVWCRKGLRSFSFWLVSSLGPRFLLCVYLQNVGQTPVTGVRMFVIC